MSMSLLKSTMWKAGQVTDDSVKDLMVMEGINLDGKYIHNRLGSDVSDVK